jgi:hypothetical protein
MTSAPERPATTPGGLAALQEEFPGFRIWQEVTGEHARLVAVRRDPGTSPHTIVTADIAELRAALNGPRQRTASP